MSALPKSTYRCPVCKQPLCIESTGDGVILWCGHGPCTSQRANDGADGLTERLAYEALCKAVDVEEPI